VIRRARASDAPAIGQVFLRARDLMTYLPRIPDADRPKLGTWIVERHDVWVEEQNGRIVAFAGVSPGWLDHLYVDPEEQNAGIGSALLDHAKQLQPDGFQLWTFQHNDGARRFYERHGFVVVERTDGAGNMEKEPDARYEWRSPAK
jgi:GNAT superfamily N-acetyltransferase